MSGDVVRPAAPGDDRRLQRAFVDRRRQEGEGHADLL
jgi:hypothetical protein